MSKLQLIIVLILIGFILAIIFALLFIKKSVKDGTLPEDISITSVFPQNKDVSVGLYPTILISFSRNLSVNEQGKLDLVSEPSIKGTKKWSPDGEKLSLELSSPLKAGQSYLIKVVGLPKDYSWVFKTLPLEQTSFEDQAKAQAEADRNAGLKQEEISRNYPWLDKLPIQTQNYFVYFDQDSKTVVAKLYPKKASNQSVESQISQMKIEIQNSLKNISLDLAKYNVEWRVTEK